MLPAPGGDFPLPKPRRSPSCLEHVGAANEPLGQAHLASSDAQPLAARTQPKPRTLRRGVQFHLQAAINTQPIDETFALFRVHHDGVEPSCDIREAESPRPDHGDLVVSAT